LSYTKRENTPDAAIDAAIASIEATGSFTSACNLLNISPEAFRQWRNNEPDLAKRVADAKNNRWKTSDYVKRTLAEAAATKALREGVTETTEIEREYWDIEAREVKTTTEVKTVRKGPPRYLVERYLGHPDLEIFSVVKVLVLAGHLPESSLVQFEDALFKFKQSISDIVSPSSEASAIARVPQEQLRDAAAAAVQRLFAQEAATVSSEVVGRPEPGEDS